MAHWKVFCSGKSQAFECFPTALLSGYACYTTFRLPITFGLFQVHFERLRDNAEFLGLDWPYASRPLYEQIMLLASPDEPVMRLTAYADVAYFGALFQEQPLPCGLLVSTRSAPQLPQARLSLQACRYRRAFPTVKWAGIGDIIHLKRTAMRAGYDDILLVNESGYLTEASTANFFAVDASGTLHTPDPERDGCLPGITRGQILALGKRLDISIAREPLHTAHIPSYTAAFLTNAVQGLLPVGRIDAHPLPWPKAVQELFQMLRQALGECNNV